MEAGVENGVEVRVVGQVQGHHGPDHVQPNHFVSIEMAKLARLQGQGKFLKHLCVSGRFVVEVGESDKECHHIPLFHLLSGLIPAANGINEPRAEVAELSKACENTAQHCCTFFTSVAHLHLQLRAYFLQGHRVLEAQLVEGVEGISQLLDIEQASVLGEVEGERLEERHIASFAHCKCFQYCGEV